MATDRLPLGSWLERHLDGILDPLRDADPTPEHAPRASVLVPIVLAAEPTILLTKRASRLAHHPGQVSLPGGRIDGADRDAAHAALREAEEEVGLDPARVRVAGMLPAHLTSTGFHVVPVVALVSAAATWRASPDEVEQILFLPLACLLDPAWPVRQQAVLGGVWREYWVWPHPEHLIWGATADILRTLALRLRAATPGPA